MFDGVEPRKLCRRDGAVYMERWFLDKSVERGVYLHHFVASDDETPHDHPRRSTSLILAGGYIEHIRCSDGTMRREVRKAGDILFNAWCRRSNAATSW
jgi:hypothetical protein